MVGLEPTRLAPLAPQASVSTNSTTSAQNQGTRYGCAGGVCVSCVAGASVGAGVVVAGGAGTSAAGACCVVPVRSSRLLGCSTRRPPRNASARLVTKNSVASTAVAFESAVEEPRAPKHRAGRARTEPGSGIRALAPLQQHEPDDGYCQKDMNDQNDHVTHATHCLPQPLNLGLQPFRRPRRSCRTHRPAGTRRRPDRRRRPASRIVPPRWLP